MQPKDLEIGKTVHWKDPDNNLCSGPVVIKGITHQPPDITIIVTRLGEEDEFEVYSDELSPLPQPNEIWRTQSGNIVLVVEHPMTEIEGNLGYVWYDENDGTMNFAPLEDQLVEKCSYHTISSWGALMSFMTGELKED